MSNKPDTDPIEMEFLLSISIYQHLSQDERNALMTSIELELADAIVDIPALENRECGVGISLN